MTHEVITHLCLGTFFALLSLSLCFFSTRVDRAWTLGFAGGGKGWVDGAACCLTGVVGSWL